MRFFLGGLLVACTTGTAPSEKGADTSADTGSGVSPDTAAPENMTCVPGQYVSVEATPDTARECAYCAEGTYSDAVNAPACLPWSDACQDGFLEAAPPSATQDRQCEDINECSNDPGLCAGGGDEGASCVNTSGSYVCECSSGFFGEDCTPVASCAAILEQAPAATDGVYPVDVDGAGEKGVVDVYCDMTTDGGGWTRCGRMDERLAGDTDVCLLEGEYLDAGTADNFSFCLRLFEDTAPSEMMVHNLTPETDGEDYGQGDRVFIDWGDQPIDPTTYDNTPVRCYHLDADESTVTDYPDCRYAAHSGDPWQGSFWSFSDGVDNGYSSNFEHRVTLGVSFEDCSQSGARWHNFGGGTNERTDTNRWGASVENAGDFYLR